MNLGMEDMEGIGTILKNQVWNSDLFFKSAFRGNVRMMVNIHSVNDGRVRIW